MENYNNSLFRYSKKGNRGKGFEVMLIKDFMQIQKKKAPSNRPDRVFFYNIFIIKCSCQTKL